MPSLDELREAISSIFGRATSGAYKTPPFFETRVTRTPGMVQPMDDANGKYFPGVSPLSKVADSDLSPGDRNILNNSWGQKGKGFIQIIPDAASKTVRHEQIHDIFDKGGLGQNVPAFNPAISPMWQNFVGKHEAYNGLPPTELADEALAFQLSNRLGGDSEQQLITILTDILKNKNKGLQANQLERLTK